jgi:hypothetical protein
MKSWRNSNLLAIEFCAATSEAGTALAPRSRRGPLTLLAPVRGGSGWQRDGATFGLDLYVSGNSSITRADLIIERYTGGLKWSIDEQTQLGFVQ